MEQYMKGPPRDTFNSDGLYSDLIDKIMKAKEQFFYDGFRANTVVVNGKKYGKFYGYYGDGFYHYKPMIAGLQLEVMNLPDDFEFIIGEYAPPELPEQNPEVEKLRDALDKIRQILEEATE